MIRVLEILVKLLKIANLLFFLETKFSFSLNETWIPKSTESPINKTANATEIKFKEPMVTDVIPKVIIKPIKIVNRIEKIT